MSRPDQQEPIVFELVERSGPDGGTDHGDAGPGGSSGRRPHRLPRLPRVPRRTWLVAAAAVAVVVLGVTAVDLVRDHRRAELMRTSPIGVASLDDPPAKAWTVPFDVAAPDGDQLFMDQQQLLTMDGLLVVPPGTTRGVVQDVGTGAINPAPVGFEDVVAVNPGSGEVAWRVPLGGNPVCGPSGYDASVSADELVCVQGPADAREVLTIAADGGTRTRAADLADGEQIFPGPDGTAVRVVRTGTAAEEVVCDLGACTPSVLTEGRDVRVVAEDAVSGDERWTSTVEFAPADTINCQRVGNEFEQGSVDADQVTVYTSAASVTVDGCGIWGALSMRGVRLDLASDAGAEVEIDAGTGMPTRGWVTELGPDLFAVEYDPMRTVVVDGAGKVQRTLDGWLRGGNVSPDAPDDLWFVTTRSGGHGFVAVREDGSVAWKDLNSQSVLLVGRDVVVADRGSRVVGLARDTGEQVWSWESGDMAGMSRYRALTDGETVVLEHLRQVGSGSGLLVALDLGTGEQVWDAPLAGSAVAVDGHVVEVGPEGLAGLG
ncbi:PQQ-binding-like beta-propeller repeat protein [Promicromonospora sp. NPDC090134]|uniref:outer membrane protein assembly factor BamB family protein n=1 Tax=Promicromonospora sp. NPDC090134 TaxID=3364408 RepID=UPI0037F39A5D